MAEIPNISSAKARAKTRAAAAPVAASSIVVPISGLQASVKLLDLAPGLYALTIEPAGVPEADLGGMILPSTLVTPVGTDPDRAEIFGAGSGGSWVGPAGGTVVLRIPAGGGRSLITTYRSAQQDAVPLSIQIAALGRPTARAETVHRSNGVAPEKPAPIAEPTLPAEITFCIDQV